MLRKEVEKMTIQEMRNEIQKLEQELENLKTKEKLITDQKEGVKNTSEPTPQPSGIDEISTFSMDIKSSNTPKDAVPREIIQARSAFATIKNYCNNLIRSSIKMTNPSPKNDNRKSINLNFFAKPIVDRPISIP